MLYDCFRLTHYSDILNETTLAYNIMCLELTEYALTKLRCDK